MKLPKRYFSHNGKRKRVIQIGKRYKVPGIGKILSATEYQNVLRIDTNTKSRFRRQKKLLKESGLKKTSDLLPQPTANKSWIKATRLPGQKKYDVIFNAEYTKIKQSIAQIEADRKIASEIEYDDYREYLNSLTRSDIRSMKHKARKNAAKNARRRIRYGK